MRFVALQLLVSAAFAGGAWAAGNLALRFADAGGTRRRGAEDLPSGFVLAPIVGLAVLAWAVMLLGLFGCLARPALLALLGLLGIAAAAFRPRRNPEAATSGSPVRTTTRVPAFAALPLLGIALAAAVGLPLFALALYAPTAFDETLYHLPFARAFADSGALPFLPELRFPVFPQLGEVLQAALLLFGGDPATHFVSVFAVGLTAALLWIWGEEWTRSEAGGERDAAGEGGGRRFVGPLAAAIWLGNPLVVYLGATSYVDPLLALFVAAASYVHWRSKATPGGLLVAGFLAGAAAGTKYLGLFFVAALAVATLVGPSGWAQTRAHRLRSACLFAAAALVAMAPVYGRIVALTANPLFPYLSGLFGENLWTPRHFRELALSSPPGEWMTGLARGAGRLLSLPWDVVARRERVGGLPPLSPVYLLGVPLLAAALWRLKAPARRVRLLRLLRLLAAPLLFLLLFPLLPADARYLFAPLPFFSLALAVALGGWFGSRAGRAALVAVVVGALALPGSLYALHRLRLQGPLPTSAVERDLYLRRMLPQYPAIAFVNGRLRPDGTLYGLHLESMRYLAHGRFLGDWYGPHRFGLLLERAADPASLHALLSSWGVDYLAVARSSEAGEQLARASAGFELQFEDPAARVYALEPRDEGE